jgi:hypothetical protein
MLESSLNELVLLSLRLQIYTCAESVMLPPIFELSSEAFLAGRAPFEGLPRLLPQLGDPQPERLVPLKLSQVKASDSNLGASITTCINLSRSSCFPANRYRRRFSLLIAFLELFPFAIM